MAGRLQEIFERAVGLKGPAREEYLNSACGTDGGLRAEVASLLRVHDQAPTFLASPMGGSRAAVTIAAPSEHEGQVIGRYKLLQAIGEGGFGSVWMAEQREPVKRRVALKIIKLGMDTKQVIARFGAERQALAMMDHPNIAKVLDAGSTETGRPYFVMEYIKGVPILEYCDTARLDTRARLDLFTSVCHAIQHAHQKGIIHRDIKPSNVLVTMHDGVAVPKVIDFGIAKATGAELTQKTLFTEHRQMIGTPAYMSPEQAEMSGLDIDTRSDVYSLGVLLYELLTGTTPFATEDLLSRGFAEMMRIIREVEPHKPSTRLSSLGATGTRTAQQRHVADPKKLGLILKGDLDWIVMKCLEKDRTRRYETANGLAADIKRHLSDEPVSAGPPGAGYRLRKFVKRNRGQAIAGCVVAVALVLGLAGTAWQAKVASAARDAEKTRADELEQVSDFQANMLAQVDPTTAGIRLTEDVNRRFAAALEKAKVPEAERAGLTDAFRAQWARVNATDAAAALIAETILKPAVNAIDAQFKDQPIIDAQLRQALADRYGDLGHFDTALTLQNCALNTRRRVLGGEHPDALASLSGMGSLLLAHAKTAEAEPYFREVLEKRRRVLGGEHPDTINSIIDMGFELVSLYEYDQAEPFVHEALEKCRRVLGEKHSLTLAAIRLKGYLLQRQGKLAEAEQYYLDALKQVRDATSITDMGTLLKAEGKFAEAEVYFREALQLQRRERGEDHPDTLHALNNLGLLLQDQGKFAEAEPIFREALEKRRRMFGEEDIETLWNLREMGVVLRGQGRLTEAEPYLREALAKRRGQLGEEHLDTVVSLNSLGLLLEAQGKFAEAESCFRDALEKRRRLLGDDDGCTLWNINAMGVVLTAQGKLVEAEPYLREALEKRRGRYGEQNFDTLVSFCSTAEFLLAKDRHQEAIDLLAPAEPAARKAFTGVDTRRLARLLTTLGRARVGLGYDAERFKLAEASLLEARSICVSNLGEKHKDTLDCVQGLIDLCIAWDKAEPGKGYDVKVEEWKAKIAEPPLAEKEETP